MKKMISIQTGKSGDGITFFDNRNPDDEEVLWIFSDHDQEAYEEGQEAAKNDKRGNPYKRFTNKWYSWNAGWNTV